MYYSFVPTQSRCQQLAVLLISLIVLALSPISFLFLSSRLPLPRPPVESPTSAKLALLTNDSLLEELSDNKQFVYFPSANVLLASIAKGGSTSLYHWFFHGLLGQEYDNRRCREHVSPNVQNIRGPCWNSEAKYLSDLSKREQRSVLTSHNTLRMAVQRDPFERLISAFNDKVECITDKYNADLGYSVIVPTLREQARLPHSPRPCMNISEFATALDRIRQQKVIPLDMINAHFRPQQLYFDEVPYDMVLDVGEIGNVTILKPVLERLPYREMVKDGIPHFNKVGRGELVIPENAAKKLYRFAMESQLGELRHLSP